MQKPLLVLKPSIVNALFPIFIKYLFRSFIFTAVVYGILFVLSERLNLTMSQILPWLAAFMLALAILPLLARTVVLRNTRYYFYPTYVVSEFKLIRLVRHSAPYNQIANIKTHASLWDRMSGAGDIILHTSENRTPDLVLSYIKNPEKIESSLYSLLHRQTPATQQSQTHRQFNA